MDGRSSPLLKLPRRPLALGAAAYRLVALLGPALEVRWLACEDIPQAIAPAGKLRSSFQ